MTDGSPVPNDRGCRVCGKIGHIARECPKKKSITDHKKQQKANAAKATKKSSPLADEPVNNSNSNPKKAATAVNNPKIDEPKREGKARIKKVKRYCRNVQLDTNLMGLASVYFPILHDLEPLLAKSVNAKIAKKAAVKPSYWRQKPPKAIKTSSGDQPIVGKATNAGKNKLKKSTKRRHGQNKHVKETQQKSS